MIILGSLVAAGILISWGVFSCIPIFATKGRTKRLRIAFGFESTQAAARAAGIQLQGRHYMHILACSAVVGTLTAFFTHNIWFMGVGVAGGVIITKMIISNVRFRRRKEQLMNLPANLRLMASKLRDCKSVQRSLEMSLPMMGGATLPLFADMYSSLQLGVDLPTALEKIRHTMGYKKFDDLSEKLLSGHREGFHARAVEGIRESIEDISSDMNLLEEIDIENTKKRMEPFIVFSFSLMLPFLFGYMESQLAHQFQRATTMQSGFGKLVLASMIVAVMVGLWQKDNLLRLNLDDL